MPPPSPIRGIEPRENVLNQIRSLDYERHHDVRARLFMGQLHDVENQTGMVQNELKNGAIGTTGRQGPPAPPGPLEPPANINIVHEYNSFNLANVTAPVPPKWKISETLLDDFRKFKHSCQRIFDRPMCHITSGKVKTSMLLIWAGPDGEDIYESFNLLPHQKYDIDYVLNRFEEFCEPICNFRMARFKFAKVHQNSGEPVDTFYNRILKIGHQCKFPDMDDRIIDAIIYGTNCVKAKDYQSQSQTTSNTQNFNITTMPVCCKTL